MVLRKKERHSMGAQAVSRDVQTMPQAPAVSPERPARFPVPPVEVSKVEELLRMLPVLIAATMAAYIAVFPLSANMSFALFCGEVGMFVLSIVVSVSRVPKSTKH
jgi:hypothetical protein